MSNNSQFEFTEAHLKQKLPKPDIELPCFDSIKIYVYDRSQAAFNEIIQQAMNPSLFKDGQVNDLKILNNNWVDFRDWKAGVTPFIDERTAPGWAYGAYRNTMAVGNYNAEITFKLKKFSEDAAVALGFGDSSVVFNPAIPSNRMGNQGEKISRSGIYTMTRNIIVTPTNAGHIWGFWIYNFGNIEMQISSAHIKREKD